MGIGGIYLGLKIFDGLVGKSLGFGGRLKSLVVFKIMRAQLIDLILKSLLCCLSGLLKVFEELEFLIFFFLDTSQTGFECGNGTGLLGNSLLLAVVVQRCLQDSLLLLSLFECIIGSIKRRMISSIMLSLPFPSLVFFEECLVKLGLEATLGSLGLLKSSFGVAKLTG
ncbi:hypothetical protein HG531_009030 [Fusarium graminearum]|nr:hypothetical protein HG531_009030 [Fusarium graminearum]